MNEKQRCDDSQENWPLSEDKPYFHFLVSKSHLKNRYMAVPVKMTQILPETNVPVVLTRENKEWEMEYIGVDVSNKKLDSGWREFAYDNDLKVGDGCVFELNECSSELVKFRVQILDGELPSELLDNVEGKNPNNPIEVD
ncbi:hypothetical protein ACHQM5_008115 [Ranunculus cassubicifolius]